MPPAAKPRCRGAGIATRAAGCPGHTHFQASASCRGHAPAGSGTARAYPGPPRARPMAAIGPIARKIRSMGRLSSSPVSPAWETNMKSPRLASRIACVAMLRQKELVEQPVHLQQGIAIQPQAVVIQSRVALLLQFVKRTRESLPNVDPEFSLKVRPVHLAQFHL